MTPGKVFLLFVVIAIAVFLPSFDNSFRDDDFAFIQQALDGGGISALLAPSDTFAFYRPGATLLFALEFQIFGWHSGLYILFNFLLHLTIALAFWRIASMLVDSEVIAAVAAGLFLVGFSHYGKQVMWACTSGPLVATLLNFAAMYLAIRHSKERAAKGSLILLLLVCFAAPAFHESGALASVLAVITFVLTGRRPVAVVALILLPAVVWGIARLALTGPFASYGAAPSGLYRALGYLIRYVGFMLVPLQQTWVGESALLVQFILGTVVMTLLSIAFWKGKSIHRFLVLWFSLTLIPFCFVELPGGWLELRYVYAATPPLLLLAVIVIRERLKTRWLAPALIVLVVACSVFMVNTLEKKYDSESRNERNTSWKDSVRGSVDPSTE